MTTQLPIPPARETAWRANSRRRCAAAGVAWQDVPLEAIYAAGGGACHVCGCQLDPAGAWDADHVTALDAAASGLHELANLRPACVGCNRSRGSAPPPGDVETARRRAVLASVILAGQLDVLGVPTVPGRPTLAPYAVTLRLGVLPGYARLAAALAPEVRVVLNSPTARVELVGAWLHVELPRYSPMPVGLAAMPAAGLAVGLGQDAAGRWCRLDIGAAPHVLIGGQTGSGKSTAMRAIVAGLARSGGCLLALADSDADTWAPFSRLATLYAGVAGDAAAAGDLVCRVAEVMNRRAVGEGPPLVLAIDEVQQLDAAARAALLDLGRRARKRRIHVLAATQYIRGDVLDRALTDQFPVRLAGRVQDATSSRLILSQAGAELLHGRGDMLLSSGGRVMRLQVAYGRRSDFAALDQLDHEPAPVTWVRPDHPGHAANDERNGAALAWAIDAGAGVSAAAIRKRWSCGMDRARLVRDEARRLITEAEGQPLPADRLTLDSGA